MDAKLIEQAKAQLAEMKQAAENLTEALGLPREATYDVMAMMYGEEPSPLGIPKSAVQQQVSEDTIKTRIFQLSEDFISSHMKNELDNFHRLWEKMKQIPLDALQQGFSQQPTASKGLGFADTQSLLPVISSISWAIINQSSFTSSNPDEIKEAIAKEAQTRGLRRSTSYEIANFIQPRLHDE